MSKMLLKHNKKRNVGLLHEFFSRFIAQAIIENNDVSLNKAKTIFKKYFCRGTALYKELKLFNSLYEANFDSKESIYKLIEAVQNTCSKQSQQQLDLEKTALLHEVNCNLGGDTFFNKTIENYKIFATVQQLLNAWRVGLVTENASEIIKLEEKLVEFLCGQAQNQEKSKKNVLDMTDKDIDQLVINIMFEKLNKKFGTALNEEQRNILNLYVFSESNSEAKNKLISLLESIKARVESLIDVECKKAYMDNFTKQKLNEVKETFAKNSGLNDTRVSVFLAAIDLESELKSSEENK